MLETIDIHPVRFENLTQCGVKESGYRQIVQCGDNTQFQMLMGVCTGSLNLIANSGFTNLLPAPWITTGGGGWTYNSAEGSYSKPTGFAGYLSQPLSIANGVLLKLSVEITIDSGITAVILGDNFVENITSSGIHEYWVTASNITSLFLFSDSIGSFSVTNVTMYVVDTNFVVDVVDRLDATVLSLNPTTHPGNFNFNNGFFTFSFDWMDGGECLPEGCYTFKVSDPCECSQGGIIYTDFETIGAESPWNVGTAWTIENGVADFSSTSFGVATLSDVLCDGVEYQVSFEIVGMTGNEQFNVLLGSATGATINADGVYVQTITSNGTSLGLAGNPTSGTGEFGVINFTIVAVERTFDYESNTFNLCDVAPCSSVIRACNDQDSLQGGYSGTGFAPTIRLEAKYGQAAYRQSFKDYETSRGKLSNYYYRGRKIKNFIFAASEYVHDFIVHLKGYDHVFIDEVEIAIENDDYTPVYVGDYNYAEGALQVSLKESLIEKRKCSSVVSSCEEDGQGVGILIDGGEGDGFNLLTENGDNLQTG